MFSLKQAMLHLLLGVLIGLIIVSLTRAGPPLPAPVLHTVPSVEMVRELSELTTLRVDLADVEVAHISSWSGEVQAAMLIKGDFAIGTDLGAARFQSVDPHARTAVLILPWPTASPPRLDHERSRLVLLRESGLWPLLPGDDAYVAVINRAYREAEQTLAASSHYAEHQQAARRQTEHVVQTFFKGIGWSISVQWE